MSFRLEKQPTVSTPYVLVDETNNYMKLEGQCFHEMVTELFADVNESLDRCLASGGSVFTFDCMFNYFNSSTAKLLFNMLMKMDRQAANGKKVIVNWITAEDNDIMIECGEDFQEELENLEFNLIIN